MKLTNRRFATSIIPLAITLTLTGCGDTRTDSKPSEYNHGQLCAEFAGFFKDVLSVNVEFSADPKFDKPIRRGGICLPARTDGTAAGQLVMTPATTSGTDEPDDSSYELQKGFDEKVWIAPGSKFRVQVGSWIGRMELNNTSMSDDQTKKAIDFLIKVTREVEG